MSLKIIPEKSNLASVVSVPGDKSITHRAVLFASLAKGSSCVRTNAVGRDNFASIRIMQQLGVEITLEVTEEIASLAKSEHIKNVSIRERISGDKDPGHDCLIIIYGKGRDSLRPANSLLDCGNSGTTARLLCGVLASSNFTSSLTGDSSLCRRPFDRISGPLGEMGARFSDNKLPFDIAGAFQGGAGKKIKPLCFDMKKASAQVKSAIVLAGLFSDMKTVVSEPVLSRDHTERMLKAMGASVECEQRENGRYYTTVSGGEHLLLSPIDIQVPGDISSAMFFLVAGLICKGDGLTVRDVGINPTRNACLSVLREMNADIRLINERIVGGEPVADIIVKPSQLKAITLDGSQVAQLIDEIPILSVAAAFAEGDSYFRGAEELRVKESDRISMTLQVLSCYGIRGFEEFPDGMKISGGQLAEGILGKVNSDDATAWMSCGDHRIIMSAAILEFALRGGCTIYDQEAVETSFPNFINGFTMLGVN